MLAVVWTVYRENCQTRTLASSFMLRDEITIISVKCAMFCSYVRHDLIVICLVHVTYGTFSYVHALAVARRCFVGYSKTYTILYSYRRRHYQGLVRIFGWRFKFVANGLAWVVPDVLTLSVSFQNKTSISISWNFTWVMHYALFPCLGCFLKSMPRCQSPTSHTTHESVSFTPNYRCFSLTL